VELSPEAVLLVREEVIKSIRRWASVFGLLNASVVAGALWIGYEKINAHLALTASTATRDAVADASRQVATFLETQVAPLEGRVESASNEVTEAYKIVGQLEQIERNASEAESRYESLKEQLTILSDSDTLDKLAGFASLAKASPITEIEDLIDTQLGQVRSDIIAEVTSTMNSKMEVTSSLKSVNRMCKNPRIAFGKSPPNWSPIRNPEGSIAIKVDTSSGDFGTIPMYFATLAGNGLVSLVVGASSVDDVSTNGFTVVLNRRDGSDSRPLLDEAIRRNWYINWIGLAC
jgi:hypothetical protein